MSLYSSHHHPLKDRLVHHILFAAMVYEVREKHPPGGELQLCCHLLFCLAVHVQTPTKIKLAKKIQKSCTRRNRVDAANNVGLGMDASGSETGFCLIKVEAVFYP